MNNEDQRIQSFTNKEIGEIAGGGGGGGGRGTKTKEGRTQLSVWQL